MIKKICLFFYFMIFTVLQIFCETKGELLFKENKPEEAILVLEDEIKNETITENSYNFLGLAYYQTGNYEKAIQIFQKGLEKSEGRKSLLYYNLGNSFFMMEQIADALDCYKSAIKIDEKYYDVYLNKANCEVSIGLYEDAVGDYEFYIEKKSDDIQKKQIEELIKLLKAEIVVQKENERIAEEERKAREIAEKEALTQMISEEIENDLFELAQRDAEELAKSIENEINSENNDNSKETIMDLTQVVEEDEMLLQAIEFEKERVRKQIEEKEKIRQENEQLAKEDEIKADIEKKKLEEEKELLETNKRAEAERRRKLLEDIATSLQVPDEVNLNSGTTEIFEYEYESELE